MSKQTLAVVVGALVLFVVAVVGALALTGGNGSNVHQMPDGSTMTGQMNGQTSTTHTMQDGQTMPGMDMTP